MQHHVDDADSMTPRFDSDGNARDSAADFRNSYGSYADSYATNYSAMSDASAADSYATHYGPLTTASNADDDIGTPPGTGGSFPDALDQHAYAYDHDRRDGDSDVRSPSETAFSAAIDSRGADSLSSYASYGSYASSNIRFGSDINVEMHSFASSGSALSPRDSNPLGHSAFFGATTSPTVADALPTTATLDRDADVVSDHGSLSQHEPQQHPTVHYDDSSSDVGTPTSPESEQQQFGIGGDSNTRTAADNHSGLSNGSQRHVTLATASQHHHHHHHAGVPASPGSRVSQQSKLSNLSKGNGTFVSQKALPRDTARELAKTALSARALSVGDVTFEQPDESNLRESIRRVQAYSRREAPIEYEMTAQVRYHRRPCELRMDRDVIAWYRGKHHKGSIDTDDIVGAEAPVGKPGYLRIHYFKQGRGTGAKALRRTHCTTDFACAPDVLATWVTAIQELVRWQARAPPIAEKRRIKVVVNPHSGKRRARQIWFDTVKQFFDLGNFDAVVEETTFSGHGTEIGRNYSADDGFEALVFIGGDGTLCEFMNGLLSRPEHEWREIVVTTPISLISAGTQNAFGIGVGIPTIAAAIYCIIKRKIRPLDVITATAEHQPDTVHYAYCGVGWGVAGDIAAESEKYRWLGTARYMFLKAKRAAFMPKKHTGRVRYIRTDPQPQLCKYDDIRNDGAYDQFEVEEGNVYDTVLANSSGNGGSSHFDRASTARKSWGGFGGALRSPASSKRYPDAAWTREEGRYMVVGVVNTAPDGEFAHPSDGNLDLIISRKGGLWRTLQLLGLYLVGQELKSPLISYIKVKSVVIDADQADDCVNMDGEVLRGGPWRLEVVPSLFKALSEK